MTWQPAFWAIISCMTHTLCVREQIRKNATSKQDVKAVAHRSAMQVMTSHTDSLLTAVANSSIFSCTKLCNTTVVSSHALHSKQHSLDMPRFAVSVECTMSGYRQYYACHAVKIIV